MIVDVAQGAAMVEDAGDPEGGLAEGPDAVMVPVPAGTKAQVRTQTTTACNQTAQREQPQFASQPTRANRSLPRTPYAVTEWMIIHVSWNQEW